MIECKWPGCNKEAKHGAYCFMHGKHFGTTKKVKEKKYIKTRSKKMTGVINKIKPSYEAYLAKPENEFCRIRLPGVCTGLATCVNHTAGRGANIANEEDWEPSCVPCNNEIENQDGLAREGGHKKSRLGPVKKKKDW